MIKKKLLIVFCRPISKIAYDKFGINFFKKKFSTKVVDVSCIIGSNSNNFKNNFIKIKNIKKFHRFLKKNEWFASAWDLKSLQFLKKYQLKFNKVASVDI